LKFNNCQIQFKKKMNHFSLQGAQLQNCKIVGKFSESEVGEHFNEYQSQIINCDFSQSVFEGVRLHNLDIDQVKLPTENHVLFLDFDTRAKNFTDADQLPGDLEFLVEFLADQEESVIAMCGTKKDFADSYEVTVAELMAFIDLFESKLSAP
jgi:hypothetical protein